MPVSIPETVRKLFEAKNYGHVATLSPDGSPHSTAVWVDVQGDHIIFNSDESYVKVKNLRRNPRVAISITDHENPYRSASVRGRVVAFHSEGAAEHIDKMSKKYMGDEPFDHLPGEHRVIVEIEPEKVYSSGV